MTLLPIGYITKPIYCSKVILQLGYRFYKPQRKKDIHFDIVINCVALYSTTQLNLRDIMSPFIGMRFNGPTLIARGLLS